MGFSQRSPQVEDQRDQNHEIASHASSTLVLYRFERITLRSGEKRRISFKLTPEALGFLDRDMRFVVEPGEFQVMVGASSGKTLSVPLVVSEKE